MNFLNDISVSNNITATGTIQSANLTLTGLSTGAYTSVLVENAGIVYKTNLSASLTVSNDTTSNSVVYPLWSAATSGSLAAKVSSTKLSFNPAAASLAIDLTAPTSSVVSSYELAPALAVGNLNGANGRWSYVAGLITGIPTHATLHETDGHSGNFLTHWTSRSGTLTVTSTNAGVTVTSPNAVHTEYVDLGSNDLPDHAPQFSQVNSNGVYSGVVVTFAFDTGLNGVNYQKLHTRATDYETYRPVVGWKALNIGYPTNIKVTVTCSSDGTATTSTVYTDNVIFNGAPVFYGERWVGPAAPCGGSSNNWIRRVSFEFTLPNTTNSVDQARILYLGLLTNHPTSLDTPGLACRNRWCASQNFKDLAALRWESTGSAGPWTAKDHIWGQGGNLHIRAPHTSGRVILGWDKAGTSTAVVAGVYESSVHKLRPESLTENVQLGDTSYLWNGVFTKNRFTSIIPTATDFHFVGSVTGDSFARSTIDFSGKIEWGPGNGARDTNLYRSSANLLKTDDNFEAVGYGKFEGVSISNTASLSNTYGVRVDTSGAGSYSRAFRLANLNTTYSSAGFGAYGTGNTLNYAFIYALSAEAAATPAADYTSAQFQFYPNGRLTLPTNSASAGLQIGSDVVLYRSVAYQAVFTNDLAVIVGASGTNNYALNVTKSWTANRAGEKSAINAAPSYQFASPTSGDIQQCVRANGAWSFTSASSTIAYGVLSYLNFSGSGGQTSVRGFYSSGIIGAGFTVPIFSHYVVQAVSNSGTLTDHRGLDIADLSGGTVYGIKLAVTSGANKYSIYTGTAETYLGGKTTIEGVANTSLVLKNSSSSPWALQITRTDLANTISLFNSSGVWYFNENVSAPVLVSRIATGTAPLTVASTTLVTNLNADLLDGQHGSYYTTFTSNYVQSRLENLITNGSGLLGNNTNFTGWTYDQIETHGGLGSFKYTGTATRYSDEYVPVDPEKYYKLVVWAKAGDTGGTGYDVNNRQYAGVVVYDIDYNVILPWHFMKYTGATDTTLAVALNTGDAVMVLTNATGWDSGGGVNYSRQFSWWPYVNAKGYTYPDYTYSRNGSFNNASYSTNGTWNAKSTNTLTLTQTWPGPNLPAGTKVRNVNSSGTFKYCLLSNVQVPNAWTRYEGYIGGYDTAGTNSATMFPYGTAFLKLLFLANYAGGVSAIIRYSDITLNEIDQRLPGSAALPAYSFYTDLDSGLYSVGANQLGFSVGGANVLTIDSNGLTLASGDKLRMPDNGAIYDTTGAIDRFSYSTNSVYNTRASGVHVFQAAGSTKVQIDATGMMKIAGSVAAFGTAYLDFSNAASLNTSSTIYGVLGEIANSGTGIIVGSRMMPRAGQTGTMTYMAGYEAITRTLAAGTVVTSSYCYRALSPVITAGSIGTSYGLHIQRQKLASGVTTGYGVYQADTNDLNYFAGATTFVGAVTAASFSGPLTGNVTGNCTGSSGSCTGNAASATNTTNIGLTDDTTTNAAMYPVWVTAATGNLPAKVSSSKFTFNPSFGTLDINGISTSLHAITLFAGSYQVNVTSGMTHTGIYTNNIGGKAMELNHGTSNWIQWGTGGSSAPTFTTSSAGTKLLIHPEVTGASADYAIGMESNAMWFGVSTTSTTFKWYGGTTSMMTLSNSVLAVGGNTVLHAGNYNTYAPTLTGTGASGSWGISVTGSAGSATTATNATNSTNAAITNDTATNAAMYPVWVTANTGNLPLKVTSTKLSFNPATSMLAVAGSVSVSGSNGGFLINRRDTGAAAWQWYSNAGNLELYDHVAGSNKISWTQAGTCTISATSTVFNGASGITVSGGASTLKASALGTAATYFAVFNGDPATSGTAVVTRTATQVRSDISAALTGAVTGSGLTMSTARLLGRTTASTGAIEEISLANGTNCAATLTATTLTVAISATPTFTDCTVTGRMNLPTSQPGSPVNGSCYWDGSTNKFWVYSSTYGWKSVTLT
ncbi:hypothetical protein EKK58_01025 [Candidatus Dependentiae bacterium]|nr:MAG: hypothetical protein EKK58_01025 [Candidatus Dependentiae bacterium]